ncbi:hypothetical protein B0I72DRAFT_141664 [Yarrowia lipolytica]|jgi:Na+-exporting ATPase|uniref:P-type Na(+) transporter n=3 Tax=Yarrowia lipolytica TaxID=4952 RepID=Q6CI72_YARLI|nr:YALI0A01023p [Yarrowia lipolytica CLIB122]QNP95021.1 Sodium transport ATPase 5 [Yarrowia lipolytica]RDW23480.1 hypothetical protein B0I71DRAFT_135884 [Yarrowia lipolytica]RDW30360.1 hypothetical protein B0I72DRAFT_141664 [Yarrowia lipolytica]RDW43926.1 hypothetical protein B0I74DRAFT_141252 [Yarrowia lipolytica]RDW50611.1 hypothetical protein B0I75DRAFT_141209 [Yarrowia lipolytica]|eukprot:XP_499639.1 YALI0A01023p [Yarrowia lipolytica CLIB122]
MSEKNGVSSNSTTARTVTNSTALEVPPPYVQTIEQVTKQENANIHQGLSDSEVKDRLAKVGPNQLDEGEGISLIKVIVGQVANAMILVLIISMCISFGIRDWIAGGVIAGVLGINVLVGVIQQYNAEKTMDSLRSLSSPTARVIRNGEDTTVPSGDIVPGDLVVVKVGDTIPADFRIIEQVNFETDEALLTGESLPIAKDAEIVFDDINLPVGDRINMAFSSSIVSKGRAKGIVTSTGMNTEIGVIAQSLKGQDRGFRPVKRDEFGKARKRDYMGAFFGTCGDFIQTFLGTNVGTPLQRRLAKLALYLFGIAVIFAIVVMAAQKFDVNREVAVYAIATALAMIPASLVVVLTITMAVGTKVMVRRNVIVRKLDSLEALGAVNDICSDKTGTLTQGKMIARKVWIPSVGTFTVERSEEPFNPEQGVTDLLPWDPKTEYAKRRETDDPRAFDDVMVDVSRRNTDEQSPLFRNWIDCASLANIAEVFTDNEGAWKATGDPTEIAIQVFVSRLGKSREELMKQQGLVHVAEHPFDSTVKRMSAIYDAPDQSRVIFTKGAVERVLACVTTWTDPVSGDTATFDDTCVAEIEKQMETLAKQGLRVLAFATRPMDASEDPKARADVEKDLHFLGLVGIYDPPRAESAPAVAKCHEAGINVHMLTGDHPGTAKAIAQEVGIIPVNLYHYPQEVVDVMVMTAMQFDALSDEEIDALPVLPLVIARCAPATKVRMIDALHRRNRFTAMTGDGVNDSPSLKKADVGIAMGIAGSDVAKDASDIVLSDDNFASILNAVEEGRRMADNIQKFVLHLLAGNVGQAFFLLLGLVFQDDTGFSVFPLSPVEVLWIIMITSAFPAMGLGVEAAQPDIMTKPPRDPKEGLFNWELITDMVIYGLWLAAICISSFVIVVYADGKGQLGVDCNKEFSESCHFVYRARALAFVEMTWMLLVLAWEVIDMRRSVFAMHPDSETPYTQVFKDLWSNQFLFWSVILGFFTVFPVVYIPVINDKVFLHKGISWEWGVAVLGLILFVIGVEMYKWAKRVFFRHYEKKQKKKAVISDFDDSDPFAKFAQTVSRSNTMEKNPIAIV